MNPRVAIGFGLVLVVLVLWISGTSPQWWLNLTRSVDMSDPVRSGEAVVTTRKCKTCHRIGDEGGAIGPGLNGVTTRHDEKTLRAWIIDPKSIKRETKMPRYRLSDDEVTAIRAYLGEFDSRP